MTVLPVPAIPEMQKRYLGATPPAGLQILAKVQRVLPPAGMDENGLPPDTIFHYSGIYDKDGKLPTPRTTLTFLA